MIRFVVLARHPQNNGAGAELCPCFKLESPICGFDRRNALYPCHPSDPWWLSGFDAISGLGFLA